MELRSFWRFQERLPCCGVRQMPLGNAQLTMRKTRSNYSESEHLAVKLFKSVSQRFRVPTAMPRFLPKLVRSIKASKDVHAPKMPKIISSPSRSTRRILPKALPPPSFSPHNRKRSILLDDVNPIIHRDAFIQHKLDSPIPPSAAGRGNHANTRRQVREMTRHECALWSDPYREGINALALVLEYGY